jgi:hypothetical protein
MVSELSAVSFSSTRCISSRQQLKAGCWYRGESKTIGDLHLREVPTGSIIGQFCQSFVSWTLILPPGGEILGYFILDIYRYLLVPKFLYLDLISYMLMKRTEQVSTLHSETLHIYLKT